MVKQPTNQLSVFDCFVGLALNGMSLLIRMASPRYGNSKRGQYRDDKERPYSKLKNYLLLLTLYYYKILSKYWFIYEPNTKTSDLVYSQSKRFFANSWHLLIRNNIFSCWKITFRWIVIFLFACLTLLKIRHF